MANNVFGIILAGGKGTRMGNVERRNSLWRLAKNRSSSTPLKICNSFCI